MPITRFYAYPLLSLFFMQLGTCSTILAARREKGFILRNQTDETAYITVPNTPNTYHVTLKTRGNSVSYTTPPGTSVTFTPPAMPMPQMSAMFLATIPTGQHTYDYWITIEKNESTAQNESAEQQCLPHTQEQAHKNKTTSAHSQNHREHVWYTAGRHTLNCWLSVYRQALRPTAETLLFPLTHHFWPCLTRPCHTRN